MFIFRLRSSLHGLFGFALCGLVACNEVPLANDVGTPLTAPTKVKIDRELIGTGFWIDRAGHVLTADHAVANCLERYVSQGTATFRAELVARSTVADLALLQADKTVGEPATFARDVPAVEDRMAFAAGYQVLQTMLPNGGPLSNAVIMRNGQGAAATEVELLSEASFGSSGAPVLGTTGLVLGVITHRTFPGHVIATKASQAKAFLAAYGIAYQEDQGPQLGTLQDRAQFAARFLVQVMCFR